MLWLRFLASLAAGLVPARLRCPPAVVTRGRGRAQSAVQTDQAHSLPPIRTTVAAGLSVGIGSRQKPGDKPGGRLEDQQRILPFLGKAAQQAGLRFVDASSF